VPRQSRKSDNTDEVNRKVSRPDSGEPRSRRLARSIRPSTLPEATGLELASEDGQSQSETGQALDRATGAERRAGSEGKARSSERGRIRRAETDRS
jgi:hypothetical protein